METGLSAKASGYSYKFNDFYWEIRVFVKNKLGGGEEVNSYRINLKGVKGERRIIFYVQMDGSVPKTGSAPFHKDSASPFFFKNKTP